MAAGGASGRLYVVPLPIGNADDVTPRAVETLRHVAVIAAEDTRTVAPLLAAHGISAPAVSYHDFNERDRSRQLIDRLLRGDDVAIVSEAGTPLVSDPGYRLVTAAIKAAIPVSALPGPCAAVVALTASGLPVDRFLFAGFPPRTDVRRQSFFAELRTVPATLIFYESPHRLVASLANAQSALGDRRACLARNLTKPHETFLRGTIGEIAETLRKEGGVRGEATLVVEGSLQIEATEATRDEARALLRDLLDGGMDSRAALAEAQRTTGLRRRETYALLVELKRSSGARREAP